MGILLDRIKEESNGNVPEYFKENSMWFYDKYKHPIDDVKNIPISKMVEGRFYFLFYKDDSNWMQYSPIFFIDFKKIENLTIIYGVNMNFIPIEIRAAFFDRYLKNFNDPNQFNGISFESAYKQLLRLGYEYAIVEYNAAQIVYSYEISISLLSKFLYSTYPKIKYDPANLYKLWLKKLETKEQRHNEIIKSLVSDFVKMTGEIKYDQLNDHITRLQNSIKKYGG